MINLILVDKLNPNIELLSSLSYQMLSLRKLLTSEVVFARDNCIKRYYLKSLDENEVKEFLNQFDHTYSVIISKFFPEDKFYRKTLSSKMQEWNYSWGYLCLILFCLKTIDKNENLNLIIVCDSVETQEMVSRWAKMQENIDCSSVFSNLKSLLIMKERFVNFLKILYRSVELFIKKFYSFSPSVNLHADELKENILIISAYYSKSIVGTEIKDPFFGNFPEYLSKDKNCICLYDSLEKPLCDFRKKKLFKDGFAYYSALSLLSWLDLINVIICFLFVKINFNKNYFLGISLDGILNWHSRRLFYNWDLNSEIYYKSIKKLCSIYKIDKVFMVYEGNCHERAIIQSLRKFSNAKIFGYCQGVSYQQNLKLRHLDYKENKIIYPDIFISTGIESASLFREVSLLPNEVICDGSSFRDIAILKDKSRNKVSKQILIALDGVYSTVSVLDWICENKKVFDDYVFKVRFHPNVSFLEVKSQQLEKMPDNFIVSDSDLNTDIKESFCILYRHTSIGIQALLNDVPAIHLAIDSPLPGDPILNVELAPSIRSAEELLLRLNEIEHKMKVNSSFISEELLHKVKEYFLQTKYEDIGNIINKI